MVAEEDEGRKQPGAADKVRANLDQPGTSTARRTILAKQEL